MQIYIHICITIFSPFSINQRNAKYSKTQKVANDVDTPYQRVGGVMDAMSGQADKFATPSVLLPNTVATTFHSTAQY